MIVAVVMLTFGVGTGISTYSWLKGARSVQGTVVELVSKRSSSKKGSKTTYSPRVRYEFNGQEQEFVSSQSSSSPDFKVGEAVRVATNPEKNQQCIATFGELYGFSLVATLVGFSISAAALCFISGDKLLRFLHPHLS